MGAKRKSVGKQTSYMNYSNVVNIQPFNKKKSVTILPRNLNQEKYVLSLLDNSKDIVLGIGPAGTGKTLLAVQSGIKLFKTGDIDKIIITRPAVSVDEDLGFLPGTLEQKMAPWTIPIMSVIKEYFTAYEIEGMINEGIIEIAPLAYMRGRSFSSSYIIADECQLTTTNQMKMLLTRVGEGSKLVITGDLSQADRGLDNGLRDFLNKSKGVSSTRIQVIEFNHNDIERHPVVEEVLSIYGDS